MLTIYLEIFGDISKLSSLDREPIYDPKYDDMGSIIQDLCTALSDAGIAKFVVSGFGQDRWPVDINYDLPSVLEQIPEVLQAIANKSYPTELYFYEQGIERNLIIEGKNKMHIIKCISGTNWSPKPDQISMPNEHMLKQLLKLTQIFTETVYLGLPKLSNHLLFKEWVSACSIGG